MSKSTHISLGYVVSVLLLGVAIVTSYSILQNIIATKRVLHKTESLINEIQVSIHDSVSVMSDYWMESRKQQPNARTLQLVKRRANASTDKLSTLLDALLDMRPALQSTGAWDEVDWIVDSSTGSTNYKLSKYLSKSNLAINGDAGATLVLPIEAAGAYNGAVISGYKDASTALARILDDKSVELDNAHKLLTAAIIVVMILLSIMVIAPLWRKLVQEHQLVQKAHSDLRRIAYTDRETGLPNLDGLDNRLRRDSPELAGESFHLLLVRINNLDELYGLIGSHQSDALVQHFSDRLTGWDCASQGWCRSGEAEFCCLMPETKINQSNDWIQAFHRLLTTRLIIEGIVARPEVSIATSRIGSADSWADVSLWQHQSNARLASLNFDAASEWLPQYSPSQRLELTEKNNLINQISEGISRRQFVPYYQLKVDSLTGHVTSVEVLARWILPDQSVVSPGVFIPVAESAGLITGLTYSLFDQVAADVQGWCAMGFPVGRVAINIAGEVLHHHELFDRLEKMHAALPADCDGLEVEITENIALGEDIDDIKNILENIRAMGVHVAIDDFGTGYASLQTLIDMPIDVLKIDRSFVQPMTKSGSGNEVVSAMISLSKKLNKRCVVEGVETRWQWQQLAELGADELQGFYFYKPASSAGIEQIFGEQHELQMTA